MTRIEQNKQIVNAAFDHAEKGNLEGFLKALSQDFKWTTTGSTGVSGTYDVQGLINEYFPKITASFESMPVIVPDKIIADENHVIRLGHGEGGVAKNGLEYNNIYCFVIEVENEKIKSITEYCDTALVEKAELGQYQISEN
ncbi:nuclear transport factor 2 family protein [Flagellimonas lutaonensis]|uniref:SnoaL-like domain-containing protein n=1 Tax=Flagellimonas lutaonensis TaxID=516051 RepID=A0A0D5YQY9_9FLAO|nr:nuclear transport factor 2 family protein [Allomuricauda lutaonensis]AKA34261.1 hypothetical protein VC82_588 [Allomuricauda lutaonensis]